MTSTILFYVDSFLFFFHFMTHFDLFVSFWERFKDRNNAHKMYWLYKKRK